MLSPSNGSLMARLKRGRPHQGASRPCVAARRAIERCARRVTCVTLIRLSDKHSV
jgi:hypothetical protein